MAEPLWIKLRTDLEEQPDYLKARQALGEDRLLASDGKTKLIFHGAVALFFEMLRKHGVTLTPDDDDGDGLLPDFTIELLDLRIGIQGFGGACEQAGWLTPSSEGLVIPRMNRWTIPFKTTAAHRERAARQYKRKKAKLTEAQNSAPSAQKSAPEVTASTHEHAAQNSAPNAKTPALAAKNSAPVEQKRAESCATIETEKETEKTTTTIPGSAKTNETGVGDAGVGVVVSELVAGEAERDVGDDWAARFAELGVKDKRALRIAGAAAEDDPRMAWILDSCRDKDSPPAWAAKAIAEGYQAPPDYVTTAEREAAENAKRQRVEALRAEQMRDAGEEREAAWAWWASLTDQRRAELSAGLIGRGVMPEGGTLPVTPTNEQACEVVGLRKQHECREGGKRLSEMARNRRGMRRTTAASTGGELPPGRHGRHAERWDEFWGMTSDERSALCGQHISSGALPEERPDREPTPDELRIVSAAVFEADQAKLEAKLDEIRGDRTGGDKGNQRAAG